MRSLPLPPALTPFALLKRCTTFACLPLATARSHCRREPHCFCGICRLPIVGAGVGQLLKSNGARVKNRYITLLPREIDAGLECTPLHDDYPAVGYAGCGMAGALPLPRGLFERGMRLWNGCPSHRRLSRGACKLTMNNLRCCCCCCCQTVLRLLERWCWFCCQYAVVGAMRNTQGLF